MVNGQCVRRQVVRRCVDVLVFLAVRGALDSRLLDLVWRASLDKHESVKQAIYMVLVDLTGHLPHPLLDVLYAHIQSVPQAEVRPHRAQPPPLAYHPFAPGHHTPSDTRCDG
jgi:hypothetical protein